MMVVRSTRLRWYHRRVRLFAASGAVVIAGEADGSTSDVLTRNASGAVAVSGTAFGVVESVLRSASGAVTVSGTANPFLVVVMREAAGAVTVDGAATLAREINDPTEIADCSAWMDATDDSTMWTTTAKTAQASAGDLVGAWDDKSGVSDFVNAFPATSSPTKQTGFIEFQSAKYLNGDWRPAAPTPVNVNAITVFAVISAPASAYAFSNPSFSSFTFAKNSNGTANGTAKRTGSFGSINTANSSTAKTIAYYCADYTGTNTVRVQLASGSEAESAAIGGSGPLSLNGGLHIGSSSTSVGGMSLFELIAYRRALTTAEIASVKAYLTAKHNL